MAYDADSAVFTAAGNYTASGRALGTTYTAGKRRRTVTVALKFATGTAASVTYSTTVAKQTLTGLQAAAFTATETLGTLTATLTVPITFHVDPGGTYSVSVTTGTAAIASWIEVDW